MMTQLFICHTQYNLILASGLSTEMDDLILFKDFNLSNDLINRIEAHFNRVLVLEGAFPHNNLKAKEKLERIRSDNDSIKRFISRYDKVFVILDMCIQEMFAMKCAFEKNRSVELVWLEDGATAYYRNGVVSSGMGSTPLKRLIRKYYFSWEYSLGTFYDLQPNTGMHQKLTSIYTCFPEYVLETYKRKKLYEITNKQFLDGMYYMFKGDPISFEINSIIIALDKIDNYANKLELVEKELSVLISNAAHGKQKVYYKCHPKETKFLKCLYNATELNKSIGLEYFLTNSSTQEITVVGIMSTALLTAKKMGFRVISIAKSTGFDTPQITEFYKKIGIECK